jgi:hypothetical protein
MPRKKQRERKLSKQDKVLEYAILNGCSLSKAYYSLEKKTFFDFKKSKGLSKKTEKLNYLKNGKNFSNHSQQPTFKKWGTSKNQIQLALKMKLITLNEL